MTSGGTFPLGWRKHLVLVSVLSLLLAMGPIAARADEGSVTFLGGGWGHAIGMSQYGIRGQVMEGVGYADAVSHYYLGSTVVPLAQAVGSSQSPLIDYPEALWLAGISAVTSASFVVSGGSLGLCHSGGECPNGEDVLPGDTWVVSRVSDGVCRFTRNGVLVSTGDCWADLTRNGDTSVMIGGVTTRGEPLPFRQGTMRIRPLGDPAAKFHISFSMDLEDYVAGVDEMPAGWDHDALAAQAVASRSFAAAMVHAREPGTRTSPFVEPAFATSSWRDRCYCHLRITSDQTYRGGLQDGKAAWTAAVGATIGEVLTHPDSAFTRRGVVEAYFGSSSSGVTETNVGGFGSKTQYPYLESVDDHWAIEDEVENPFATWEKTVSATAIRSALASTTHAWAISFDNLTGVAHLSGPPESWVRFTGVVGGSTFSVDVPGWWLASAFGLRSPQVSGVTGSLAQATDSLWHQGSQAAGTIQSPIEPGDQFAFALASGDFDGDGFDDLAVGAPTDGVNAVAEGGLINVLFGSTTGLVASGNQMFHQNSSGVPDVAEVNDHFGWALAAGDFNGDGKDDLVVGVPDEDVGSAVDAGRINVFLGSSSGLVPGPVIDQDTPGVPGGVEAGDRFGAVLVAADFNGDGYDDVAIGTPGEAIGTKAGAGAVVILFGSGSGLTGAGSIFRSQNTPGIGGVSEPGDHFGAALATGDLNGDGHVDLVVGSPGEALGSLAAAGMLHVLPGSAGGPQGLGSKTIHQGTALVPGVPEANDDFSASLAAGDVDGDGVDELVVGMPGEALGPLDDAGMVVVLDFSASLVITRGSAIHQGVPGVNGGPETGDRFGFSILVGNFTGDPVEDLAIGAPGEAIGSLNDAGLLHLIAGSSSGLLISTEWSYQQNQMPIAGGVEAGDRFAFSLALGDFDRSGARSLVVGSPGEDIGKIADAGWFQTVTYP